MLSKRFPWIILIAAPLCLSMSPAAPERVVTQPVTDTSSCGSCTPSCCSLPVAPCCPATPGESTPGKGTVVASNESPKPKEETKVEQKTANDSTNEKKADQTNKNESPKVVAKPNIDSKVETVLSKKGGQDGQAKPMTVEDKVVDQKKPEKAQPKADKKPLQKPGLQPPLGNQVPKVDQRIVAPLNRIQELLKKRNQTIDRILAEMDGKRPVRAPFNAAPPPALPPDPLPAQPGFPGRFPQPPRGNNRAAAQLDRLGIEVTKPSAALTDQLDLPKAQGLIVSRVAGESPASAAGIKEHDVLLEIDGKAVPDDPRKLAELLKKIEADKEIAAVVLRKGKNETIKGIKLPKEKPGKNGFGGFPPQAAPPPGNKLPAPPETAPPVNVDPGGDNS